MVLLPPSVILREGLDERDADTTLFANWSEGIEFIAWLAHTRCIICLVNCLYKLSSGMRMPDSMAFFAMLDRTAPGATCVQWIPNGLNSIQSTSLIPRTAALLDEYMPFQGVGLKRLVRTLGKGRDLMYTHITDN